MMKLGDIVNALRRSGLEPSWTRVDPAVPVAISLAGRPGVWIELDPVEGCGRVMTWERRLDPHHRLSDLMTDFHRAIDGETRHPLSGQRRR